MYHFLWIFKSASVIVTHSSSFFNLFLMFVSAAIIIKSLLNNFFAVTISSVRVIVSLICLFSFWIIIVMSLFLYSIVKFLQMMMISLFNFLSMFFFIEMLCFNVLTYNVMTAVVSFCIAFEMMFICFSITFCYLRSWCNSLFFSFLHVIMRFSLSSDFLTFSFSLTHLMWLFILLIFSDKLHVVWVNSFS